MILNKATYDNIYEYYNVSGKNCEYLIDFHKKNSLTSWISLPSSGENKEEIREILGRIDNFRLSLYEITK